MQTEATTESHEGVKCVHNVAAVHPLFMRCVQEHPRLQEGQLRDVKKSAEMIMLPIIIFPRHRMQKVPATPPDDPISQPL